MNYKKIFGLALVAGILSAPAWAGNDTKRGQAGATELLVNPWARTSGFAGANSGIIRGVESFGLNIAGLCAVRKTEFTFCTANYLVGSDIRINSLGLAQRTGDNGVMGITMTAFDMGDFYETTVDVPEGTGTIFKPQIFNFGLAYSQKFSDRITGGMLIRGISQSYNSASAFGIAFDAGIQYQTGRRKEFKFGVSMMNWGPKMNFSGPGLTSRGTNQGTGYSQTIGLLSAAYEQASMLNIGFGYDFNFDTLGLKITPCFNFRSNSFTFDQYQVGAQASWKEMFMIRAGYDYQEGIFTKAEATTANMGPSFGATYQMSYKRSSTGDMVQMSDKELAMGGTRSKMIGLDYSYSMTRYFGGTHRISILLSL